MSLNRFPHAFAEPARARVSGKEERNVLDEFIGTTGYATQTELSGQSLGPMEMRSRGTTVSTPFWRSGPRCGGVPVVESVAVRVSASVQPPDRTDSKRTRAFVTYACAIDSLATLAALYGF